MKDPFCICWHNRLILLFLLMWYVIFTDLHILIGPCIPGMNPTCSFGIIVVMCCWIQFASSLLRFFTFMFIKGLVL